MRVVGRTISLMLGVAAVAMVLWSVPASAAILDPATLHLGPGTNPGCTGNQQITGCAGDPNVVTGNLVTIYQNSGGASPLITPQLLFLAVPNDSTDLLGATNPISGVTYINPFPGGTVTTGSSGAIASGQFGINDRPLGSTFFYGNMSSGDIYSFLGLSGPGVDASNNVSNYMTEDAALGVSADNWGIYGFALSGQTLDANGVVETLLAGLPPVGTFAAAYGQDGTGPDAKAYVNPFTEAAAFNDACSSPGLCKSIVPTPEPSAMSLMSLGAGALALLASRRGRREDS
jgi:hypothetical protein